MAASVVGQGRHPAQSRPMTFAITLAALRTDIRPLIGEDMATIENWPVYPAEFDELDYALRKDGWLTEFYGRPDTWLYGAEEAGKLIGFAILAMTAPGEAEFRIALRAEKLGQGLGRIVTVCTLIKGFGECGLGRIHLIVRKNNRRAIELYQRLGFTLQGDCLKIINNRPTDFFLMEPLRPEQLF